LSREPRDERHWRSARRSAMMLTPGEIRSPGKLSGDKKEGFS
jgi:hypothetical protein